MLLDWCLLWDWLELPASRAQLLELGRGLSPIGALPVTGRAVLLALLFRGSPTGAGLELLGTRARDLVGSKRDGVFENEFPLGGHSSY